MKRTTLLVVLIALTTATKAQTDTTFNPKNNDTIRIGNILIIKKNKKAKGEDSTKVVMQRTYGSKKNSRISTNWWIVDVGFANYNDQTDYASAGGYLVNKPGSPAFSSSDFKLRTAKSINLNIWFFMQRLGIVKNYVNLKYGLGLELNNYRYKSSISYKEDGTIPYSGGMQTNSPFIFRDSISFTKNKLAADYLTLPLMLNFSTNPHSSKKGISFSAGVSAGYLYGQRNKQKSEARGKDKNKGEYDLEKFKLSYVGELGLGPVRLYGSYSPKSMYERGLDIRPYNFGFRLSNW
ncbi:MAG: outer membrane beta-barrel protein [Ferruginibacter sp.]